MDEIKETAKRTLVEKEEEAQGLNTGGNDTLNQTRILNQQHLALRQEKEKEAEMKLKSMLKDLTKCIESVGYLNPINKVYKLTKELEYFPLAATLMTFNALMQLSYDPLVFNLQRKQKEFLIDGPHFIVGLITIFKQFHFNHYKKYILFLVHYIKTALYANS